MRGQQFGDILEGLRLESKRSASTALGLNEAPALKRMINRLYEFFWFDYNWSFLKIMNADKAVSAGVFMIDPPTTIDLERIEKVAVRFGNIWRPVARGITTELYNAMDSDLDVRSEPIENYDIQWTGSESQIVLWPRPSTDTTLRFQGRVKFSKMVDDSDTCLLDDQLIILFGAAELLAEAENPKAPSVANAAQRLYNTLKYQDTKNRNSKFNLGGSDTVPASTRGEPEIRVAIAPVSGP